MDLRYMLTLEKILNLNNKDVSTAFVTVYKNKKHFEESMSGLMGLGEKLERFDDKFDVLIVVGDGKGNTMFYKEGESLEAWEQYRDFVSVDYEEKSKRKPTRAIVRDVKEPEKVDTFNNRDNKNKRIEGWDNF